MTESFKLSNGLKVLLIQNKKAPVITIQSWVRTGSADEQKGQEGLSHFIEHLLFKGTEKFKVGEIAQIIEGAGGELNAYTSFDQTVFYMTLSSQFADLGLEAMSQMMGRPLFDKQEVDNEREVVIEEIKRSNDSPSRVSSQNLFSTVYEKHPYKRPVIGYDHIIQKTPVAKIKKLYFERYCPENMFLIVVGDFEKKEIVSKIKSKFSILEGKLKKVTRPKEPKQIKSQTSIQKTNFKDCFLNVAFKTQTTDIKEIAALDLISYILTYGDTTRLVQSLRLQENIVSDLGAYQFDGRDPGFFTITLYMKPENLKRALEILADEILTLHGDFIKPEELQKAIVQIESSEFYQETMDALARRIGNDQFMHNDPEFHKKYTKILKSLKPSEINKIIKKYFRPENLNVSVILPEDNKAGEKIVQEWQQDFSVALKDFEKIVSDEKLREISKVSFQFKNETFKEEMTDELRLSSGARLILRKLPGTQVVSARVGFLGGVRADPDSKVGICDMISRTWLTGTKNRNENEISSILEESATYLSPYSGRNSLGLHLQTLQPKEAEMSGLLAEAIACATYPEKEFSREKEVLQNYHLSLQDHPSTLVFLDFMKCLFKNHPYAYETFGTAETVARIQAKDARDMHSKLIVSSNLITTVAGNIDIPMWKEWFRKLDSNLKKGEKFEKYFPHDSVNEEQKTFKTLAKEQSHIIYGFKGTTIKEESRHVLQLLQTLLSGQGGRLFLNLRDKASLAYSVSPVRMDGVETGYFGAYIGCSPDKGKKAISMIKDEFAMLVNENVSEEELARTKMNIIGKHDISLQKTSTISQGILFDEIYGVKYLEPKEFAEKINSITAEDIRKLSERLFTQKAVISCVGPICPW